MKQQTQTPPGPVTQTSPRSSHFIPSGPPLCDDDWISAANSRSPDNDPSGATLKTRISFFALSLT